ncbi:preprotein translocase subunit SecG [Flavisolibacter sp. BT320]|jgi:preprotein translocase subunit SecG|nr:preprotein translocase subunit SecG [Flavisolibacter longurius]
MTTLFIILIILACVVLTLIVLVQNPKGGGLAGNIAGFSNQFMGVKQTNDVLEKGTWIFAGVIAVLCIVSTLFISGGESINRADNLGSGVTNTQQTAPAPAPQPVNPAPQQP